MSTSRRRVLMYVLTRDPALQANPRTAHVRTLLQQLADTHRVVLIAICEPKSAVEIAGVEIHYVDAPGFMRLAPAFCGALIRRAPLQLQLVNTSTVRRAVGRAIRSFSPDVIVYDTLRALPLRRIDQPQAVQILDMDDLFSRRYERMLSCEGTPPSLMGNVGRRFPILARVLVQGAARTLLRHEARTLKELERSAPGLFDHVVLFSSAEADWLRIRTGAKNVHCIPQFVPAMMQNGSEDSDPGSGTDAFFFGDFRYAANQMSLDWLVDEIVPCIAQSLPAFRLHVFGPRMPNPWRRRLHGNPHIVVHGFVDDLREAVSHCGLCLAPVRVGSGVKTKILEAMAWGKAVVSNRLGFEGIPVEHGIHGVYAEGTQAIAAAVADLAGDAARRAALGRAARERVRSHFSLSRLAAAWQGLVDTPAG